jgi:hypothetical protein
MLITHLLSKINEVVFHVVLTATLTFLEWVDEETKSHMIARIAMKI